MTDGPDDPGSDVYHNVSAGATANPVMPDPDDIDADFVRVANDALSSAVEVMRRLVPSHQAAAAIIVQGDWSTARKYFSLSPKYADWADYATPATGFGSHGWLYAEGGPVRLTQAELEAHPSWRGFGTEAAGHPPMRGWLAAPIVDSHGTRWGLAQLSDRVSGEYTADDEAVFTRFVGLLSAHLESAWLLRDARKAGFLG